MKRSGFHVISALLALAAIGAAAAPPIAVSVHVGRTTLDLLDSVDVQIVAHNATRTMQTLRFPMPVEYEIDVLDDRNVIWTSLPASPPPNVTFAPHVRSFASGPTTVVVYDWNGLATGGWSPAGGAYTVRARLLADGAPAPASFKIAFTAPLPPSAVAALKPGQPVTIAGRLDAAKGVLADTTGSVRLSRRLLAAPAGVDIAIRGYADDHQGPSRTFTFERWAPLGKPAPTPAPLPVPAASPLAASPHPAATHSASPQPVATNSPGPPALGP